MSVLKYFVPQVWKGNKSLIYISDKTNGNFFIAEEIIGIIRVFKINKLQNMSVI